MQTVNTYQDIKEKTCIERQKIYGKTTDLKVIPLDSRSKKVMENEKNLKKYLNKKVPLRERKRHTARRVASACYAALCNAGGGPEMGNPPPDMEYPPRHGVPPRT